MWLVKIGGSLFPKYALKLLESLVGKDVMVICGGGELSDKIREYDSKLKFSKTTAHDAAILCMDIIGMLLADLVDNAEAVDNLRDARKLLKNKRIPIILPSKILHYLDPLEHSWSVTSDSISLFFSHLLNSKLLIATNVDGIYTKDPSLYKDAKFIKEINAKKLLSFGETSVDKSFAKLLLKYKTTCYVANGKYPDRIVSILEGKGKKCTIIRGD